MNRAERVIAYLEGRGPLGFFVDGEALRGPGGKYAWRTAVSEARILLKPRGRTIENRQRFIASGGYTISEYAIVELVPSDPPVLLRGHDMNDWGLS